MKRLITVVGILAVSSLAACKTTEEIAKEDNEQCKSMGVYPGTPGYPECRMFLVQQRNQQKSAAMNAWAAMQATNKPPPSPTYTPPRSVYCMPVGTGFTCN